VTVARQGAALLDPEWRIEGVRKVTGTAAYLADQRRDGMLHAAFARSPLPHARLVAVDVSAALAMAGVRAVLTGEDVRPIRLGRRLQDWPLLAWDTVRFVGDPVAAVAAETLGIAEAAVARIRVDYDELPAVFDPVAALGPDAPVLHPDPAEYRYLGGERPPRDHPNLQGQHEHRHGDVEAAMRGADLVVDGTFAVPRQFPLALEPHGALVWLEGERFRVNSTNKSPFRLRDNLELSLDIPKDQLVIDSSTIGGDFGGKGFSADEYVLTILARRTGRPVRSVPRLVDDLRATNTRHAAVIRMRTGFDASGRIVAHESDAIFDGGAYAAAKGNVNLVPGGALHTLPGYAVPHARIVARTAYTNHVPGGHMRAPGQPQNSFAAESQLDIAARQLGIEPLELRRRNVVRDGGTDVLGRAWPRSSMVAVIDTLRRESRWDDALPRGRGRGLALGARTSPSGGRDGRARASVQADGRVEILTGIPDQGGGALTAFQRIAAEALGISIDRVAARTGTTAEADVDLGVGGSRVTPVVGGAVLLAATELGRRLDAGWPDRGRTEQLRLAAAEGGLVVQELYEHPAGVFSTFGLAVEVDVDRDTGRVSIADATFVADVGTVINPLALRGQLVGALVSGLGQAISEEVAVEDGVISTANLGDYKLPTMPDVPPFRVVLLDGGDGSGPFGAKSAGELGNIAVPAAIANAVADAVGVRIVDLPITAERVWAGLAAAVADAARP
jgi:CO/xanthine dehydrogenase Mo-binding subunit